ncbi:glycosyltransferase family 39 protein [bacterium]|nr:glycosyltransferase family 39 protein [bacterium]
MRGYNLSFKPSVITFFVFLSILFISIGVYWKSFDIYLVEEDPKVLLPESFESLVKHFIVRDWFYYRPLLQVVWSLEWRLFGADMFNYHLLSFIFNFLNIYLVYLIVFIMFEERYISYLAAVVFAFHPTHTEAITWVSPQVDLIVTSFYLLAFFYFLKFIHGEEHLKAKSYFLAFVFFILGLFSKEMAFTFPAAIFVYDFLNKPRSFFTVSGIVKKIFLYIPYLLAILIYFWFRLSTDFGSMSTLPPFNVNFFISNISEALRMLTLPVGLLQVYIVFLIFLLSFDKRYFYFFLFVFITMIPVIPSVMKERYLLLPSVGTSIMTGYIIYKILLTNRESRSRALKIFKQSLCWLVVGCIMFYSAISISGEMKSVQYKGYQSSIIPKGIKKIHPTLPEGSEVYMIFLPEYHVIPEELVFVEIESCIYFEYGWMNMKYGILSDFFKKYFDKPLPPSDKIYFFNFDGTNVIERNDFKDKIYQRDVVYNKYKRGGIPDMEFSFGPGNKDRFLVSGNVEYTSHEDELIIYKTGMDSRFEIEICDIPFNADEINSVFLSMSATDTEIKAFPVFFIWNREVGDKESQEIFDVFPDGRQREYRLDMGYDFEWVLSSKIDILKLVFREVPETVILHRIVFSCNKWEFPSINKGIDLFKPF